MCGGLMEIKTPAPILMKFSSPPVQGRFWYAFDPSPLGLGVPKKQKAEGHIFKMLSRLQINPGIYIKTSTFRSGKAAPPTFFVFSPRPSRPP